MEEPAKEVTMSAKKSERFTAEERAAMRERAKELKAEERASKDRAAGERAVLEKIAEMPASDRDMAERIHTLVTKTAPELIPRTWYGMPAYAKDGKVLCYFQDAAKFKSKYATFGFSDKAALDDGGMWPTALALKELSAAVEARIGELLKRAVR